MKVVAIDTAGPVIGVALHTGSRVLARTERVQRGSEARLVPWAQALLDEAGLAWSDVEGIGVARGPGAFTGLRVGLATAIGLSVSLGRPLWACDSLATRAGRVGADRVLSLLDARKQRVYVGWYEGGAQVGELGDLPPEEAVALARAPFVATGEGALVYRHVVEAAGGRIADDADHPAVDTLAEWTADALTRGEQIDPTRLSPLYLRAPDAKIPKSMNHGADR